MRGEYAGVTGMARWVLWVAVSGILAGCSGESTHKVTTTRRTSTDPLIDRFAGNYQYAKGSDGSTKIVSDRRSQYEGRRMDEFGKSIAHKQYATREQKKRSWWGKKNYEPKAWLGAKRSPDAGRKSWFASKHAKEGGEMAAASGKRYNKTGAYETGAAYEAGTRRLGHPQDARVENLRATSPKPKIIGWEEQRRMSMEQTRSLLGR